MAEINKIKGSYVFGINKPDKNKETKKIKLEQVDKVEISSYKGLVPVVIVPPATRPKSIVTKGPNSSQEENSVINKLKRLIKFEGKLPGRAIKAQINPGMIKKLEEEGYHIFSDEPQEVLPSLKLPSCRYKVAEDKEISFIPDELLLKRIEQKTGKGVGVVVLDTGVAPHPDLKEKIVAFLDLVNGNKKPYDDNGHGTFVAGLISGSSKDPDGKVKGVASQSNIIGIKVVDKNGNARISDVIRGIYWAIENKDKYNIRVINISLGFPSASSLYDPIDKAIKDASLAGITVVTAAGNRGPSSKTITEAPANSPLAITVGAADNKRTPDPADDEVAHFSSRGPTPEGIAKPDLLAPGVEIVSLNVPGSKLEAAAKAVSYIRSLNGEQLKKLPEELLTGLNLDPSILKKSSEEIKEYLDKNLPNFKYVNKNYIALEGTSVASPIVAGVIANMYEANPNLTPEKVKDILKSTSRPLGTTIYDEGSGIVDEEKAVAEALQYYIAENQRKNI